MRWVVRVVRQAVWGLKLEGQRLEGGPETTGRMSERREGELRLARPGHVVTFLVRASATVWTFLNPAEVRMSPLLSVEEAATELGTPVRFVRRLVHERRIRFHKIGKYVRIARVDLEAFIAASAVPSFAAGGSRAVVASAPLQAPLSPPADS